MEWGWLKEGLQNQSSRSLKPGLDNHARVCALAAESALVGRGGPERQMGVGSVVSGKCERERSLPCIPGAGRRGDCGGGGRLSTPSGTAEMCGHWAGRGTLHPPGMTVSSRSLLCRATCFVTIWGTPWELASGKRLCNCFCST